MSMLQDKQGRLAHLRKEWQTLYESKPNRDFSADEVTNLKSWNAEMHDLGAEIETLKSLEVMSRAYSGGEPQPVVDDGRDPVAEPREQQVKSLRERITENAEFKRFIERGGQGTFMLSIEPEEKTLITLGDVAPQAYREPRIVPMALETRMVGDLLMQGTIDRGTLEYYEETTLTNNAAAVAEGDAKPESALDWTLRTEALSKIATWIPVTSEALQDVSFLESTIRNRLVYMVKRAEEAQIISGSGTAPNLRGILNRTGLQTQALGTDPMADAILKAANKVRINSFEEPSAVVINPIDMEAIRIQKTTDGAYIFGTPSDPYTALRLWGMEVRETTAMTAGTPLVGAFATAAQLFRRGPIQIVASTEHSTYFTENKVAILAEERVGLAVYRPAAFCQITA